MRRAVIESVISHRGNGEEDEVEYEALESVTALRYAINHDQPESAPNHRELVKELTKSKPRLR